PDPRRRLHLPSADRDRQQHHDNHHRQHRRRDHRIRTTAPDGVSRPAADGRAGAVQVQIPAVALLLPGNFWRAASDRDLVRTEVGADASWGVRLEQVSWDSYYELR